jgi:hypothetical protein
MHIWRLIKSSNSSSLKWREYLELLYGFRLPRERNRFSQRHSSYIFTVNEDDCKHYHKGEIQTLWLPTKTNNGSLHSLMSNL